MKTKKYLKIASLAVVAAIFIWTFVFLYRKSQPTVKVYETIVPETADLEKTTVATGKVEPRDEVLIKPQISGIISEVYKEAGQSVKQGEVIAKVKVIPELGTLNSAESRVRLAEINAKQAETDFARVEKLFNDKLISNEEYEKGEVNVKQSGNRKGRYHQEQRFIQQHIDSFHHYRTDSGRTYQSRQLRYHEQYVQRRNNNRHGCQYE